MNHIFFCCPMGPLSPRKMSVIENTEADLSYAFDLMNRVSRVRGMWLTAASGSIVRQPAPDGPWTLPYSVGNLLGQCGLSFTRG